MNTAILLLLPLAILAGCKDDTASLDIPEAHILTSEASGHYCQMNVLMHPGPKVQVFLADTPAPLWFVQVRDGIAYLKSPEQTSEILVLYVSDMGEAGSWAKPGIENWVDASTAYFVVGSDAVGGMGAPEIVPFSDRSKAEKFMGVRGGSIMRLDEIPAELVLSPVETNSVEPQASE